jgi:opacity protein-like surface antigen
MKTVTLLAISALVFFSIAAAPAPEKETSVKKVNKVPDEFTSLRSHRKGKGGAEVSWSFSSSSGVSGFVVERTNEDPNDPYSVWVTVGSQGCNGSRSYKCCDETPFPGYVNYRVTAVLNNGTTIQSGVSVVHIASH